MSTLKVNKIRDTAGSADAIVLDPSGGVKMSGICTATTFDGSATSLTQIPAANLVGVCTSGLTRTGGFGKFSSYAIIADVKASNGDGGTFTSGAWRTRDLNTELSDEDSLVSISSNQFTLVAGTYLIVFSAPAHNANSHQTRLYNISTSLNVQYGQASYSGSTASMTTHSRGVARLTIASSTVFEIQHRCASTTSTYGLGVGSSGAMDWGSSDATNGAIYCVVEIYKEA